MYLAAPQPQGMDGFSSDYTPLVYLGAGALLAYLLLKSVRKSRRRRKQAPLRKISPRPLRPARFEVEVDGTLSRHVSEYGAKKELRRFTRRGIPAKLKEIR
jgi:hypothetical protein